MSFLRFAFAVTYLVENSVSSTQLFTKWALLFIDSPTRFEKEVRGL